MASARCPDRTSASIEQGLTLLDQDPFRKPGASGVEEREGAQGIACPEHAARAEDHLALFAELARARVLDDLLGCGGVWPRR